MARTIKRGTPPRARRSTRKQQKPSFLMRTVNRLPIGETAVRRVATWALVGIGGALALTAATWLGVPGSIGTAIGEGIGRAGLRVNNCQATGMRHIDEGEVCRIALDQPTRAMPLVDLAAIRQQLVDRGGWIADAHVSRRLPDTLVVSIVERQPAALWQQGGRLWLIADNGAALEPVSANAMPDLPLVVGPHANEQEVGYRALLAAAPTLRPQIRAATWIGNRRWNISFESGETLLLPQGDDAARQALVRFARMQGANPLLGRGWAGFDMRDDTRFIARRPDTGAARAITDAAATTPPQTTPVARHGASGGGRQV